MFPLDTIDRKSSGREPRAGGEEEGGHVPAPMFDTKASRTSAFAGLIAGRASLP